MKSIIKKIVFIISLFVLLSSCNFFYKNNALKYLKNEAELNSERLSYYLSSPVWNFDSTQIQKILELEIKNGNINGILVYTNNNLLLAAKYNHNFELKDIEKISLFFVKKDIIYNSDDKNENIGYFIIYYTDKNINKYFNNNF